MCVERLSQRGLWEIPEQVNCWVEDLVFISAETWLFLVAVFACSSARTVRRSACPLPFCFNTCGAVGAGGLVARGCGPQEGGWVG